MKKDPVTFMEAFKEAAESYQKESAKKALEDQFKNPAKIPTEGRVAFGEASAPITIVEYSDFQCPYCAKAAKSMRDLKDKYKGKVKVVYKHFPLSFHPFAKPAAEYFEAVALVDQAKARQFHDTIFDNFSDYAKLNEEKEITQSLKTLVKKMGLNQTDIEKNMEKAKKVVEEDMKEGRRLDVRGTPSFFCKWGEPSRPY